MTVLNALLLGVVQGLTEFLPISSKGHLALASMSLGFENDLTFDVLLHVATLGAILWFFRETIVKLRIKQWFLLGVATIPVGLTGVFIEDSLERWLRMPMAVVLGLLVTAGLNFYAQWKLKHMDADDMPDEVFQSNKKRLLFVGLMQSFALLPGVSRSGTTLISGLGIGLSKKAAFDWAFLLAVPAIAAATLYEGWDVFSNGEVLPPLMPVITGMGAAFIVGLLSLKLLRFVLKRDEFWIFGVYCLLLAGVVFFVTR